MPVSPLHGEVQAVNGPAGVKGRRVVRVIGFFIASIRGVMRYENI